MLTVDMTNKCMQLMQIQNWVNLNKDYWYLEMILENLIGKLAFGLFLKDKRSGNVKVGKNMWGGGRYNMGLPRPHTNIYPQRMEFQWLWWRIWEPSSHASNCFLEKNIKISYMVSCSTLLCCCSWDSYTLPEITSDCLKPCFETGLATSCEKYLL